jgi:Ca-activated chloride channel family protein
MAIDVSLSMRANDVLPDRITAAQAAARSFIEDHPPRARIGIVSFGGSAQLVQKPTDRSEDLIAAIDRFQLQRGTATGSALVVSLATLFPDEGIDVESVVFGRSGARDGGRGVPIDKAPSAAKPPPPPVKPGSYTSGVIVLLSDGRRTTGPDPIEVAKMAADRGVRVFTVGFGTVEGATIGFEGWSAYVRLDEETLKGVAEITRGEYYHAGTAADLKKVYQELNTRFVMERKDTEVTALFSALAALLAAAAGILSIAWFGRFA